MPNFSLGQHFEIFVARQIASGRFQNASEVVRAGLRLLEDHEASAEERRRSLAESMNAAFDDPGADIPAEEAFNRLETKFAADVKAQKRAP